MDKEDDWESTGISVPLCIDRIIVKTLDEDMFPLISHIEYRLCGPDAKYFKDKADK